MRTRLFSRIFRKAMIKYFGNLFFLMGAGIDGVRRKGAYNGRGVLRPSDYGTNLSYSRDKCSPETKKKLVQIAKQRRQAIAQQVLEAYEPGWQGFTPAQKASRYSIALALLRTTRVKGCSPPTLIKILVSLARAGKIKIPKKTNGGMQTRKK